MNVLFFLNTKKKFFDNQLGGIETLNKELFDYLKKSKIDFKKIIIVNRISKILYKIKWDAIISSNNARIFDKLNSQNKILWMHNVLQVEKAIRKKQLLPILRNKITAVFNSHYLKKKTSFFYFFKKKKVISNFLSQKFYNLKIDYKRKPYFIWSVQRTKGLDRIIHYWSKNIYLNNNKAKLYIFGVNKSDAAKLSIKDFKNEKSLKKSNILNKIISYLVVFIISFVALIIVLDTFKTQLSNILPNLELFLFNLYETFEDIGLFLKDLIK